VTADIDGDPRNPIVTRQGADEEELFTGIDVPVEMSGLSIVPNPSVGPAMLHFPVADEVQDLRVINAVGQLVYQGPSATWTVQSVLGATPCFECLPCGAVDPDEGGWTDHVGRADE
jgi:hypothetical protein